jgi:hypothetical protein
MLRFAFVALSVLAFTACNAREAEAPAEPTPVREAAVEVMGADAPPSTLLPGAWVSVDDPKSVVTITPDAKYIETYDGADETTSAISWVSNCTDAPVGDAGPYLLVTGGGIERCFKMVYVGADRLELMYIGRGNTLAYTRIHD